jgi:hypothetical protein
MRLRLSRSVLRLGHSGTRRARMWRVRQTAATATTHCAAFSLNEFASAALGIAVGPFLHVHVAMDGGSAVVRRVAARNRAVPTGEPECG